MVDEPFELVDEFNRYFTSLFTNDYTTVHEFHMSSVFYASGKCAAINSLQLQHEALLCVAYACNLITVLRPIALFVIT